jgi:outer membrane protein OmpA-like peptidoglycan-associated protein
VKPLTAEEIDEIVTRNTQNLIKNQDKGVKEIKDLINDLFKKEAKEVEDGYRLQTVWGFNLDKTDILPSMTATLEENLKVLKEHPELRVNLTGNTDDLGSDPYNINLGSKRSQVVKDWLIKRGIAENRLVISSNGYRSPAIPNVDDANRRYNRRVEFIVIK